MNKIKDLKDERELILSNPIMRLVIENEAKKAGVSPEEYTDRFLDLFYKNPSLFPKF